MITPVLLRAAKPVETNMEAMAKNVVDVVGKHLVRVL